MRHYVNEVHFLRRLYSQLDIHRSGQRVADVCRIDEAGTGREAEVPPVDSILCPVIGLVETFPAFWATIEY